MNTIESNKGTDGGATGEEVKIDLGDEGAGEGEGAGAGEGEGEGQGKKGQERVESEADKLARYQRGTNQQRKKLGLDPIDFEGKKTPPKKGKESESPTGLDYGQKAFLISLGYKSQDQMDLAFKAMQDTGKTLEQIIDSKWFKEDVEALATKAAVPTGKGRTGQASATDTVEYWIAKGQLPPADQVELRRKVVNAKIAKEKSGNVFSANPVIQ